jgi:hypothetical protein
MVYVAALAVCLAAGVIAGGLIFAGARTTDADAASADIADILALKAEAEALVLSDRLPEAHATYRRLTALAVGRDLRGRLSWDLLERAKVDQDRVFWIILTRTRGAQLAFNRGRPWPNPAVVQRQPSR